MSQLSPIRRAPTRSVTAATQATATVIAATTINGPITRPHFVNATTVVIFPTPVLTTLFTPPIACFTDVYDDLGSLEIAIIDNPTCYPPSYSANIIYSPGICPSDYYTQARIVGTNETLATCCPINYTLKGDSSSCQSGFDGPSEISSNFFTSEPISTTTIEAQVLKTTSVKETSTTVASTLYSRTNITVTQATTIYAPTIQVQFRSNDTSIVSLLSLSAASASSAAAAFFSSTSTATISTASSTDTSTSAPSPTSAMITGGAIAGIVIGVLALLILVAGVFLIWHRRKNKDGSGLGRNGSRWRKSELEANSPARAELAGEKDIKEMPSNEAPVELPGSLPPISTLVIEPAAENRPGTAEHGQVL